MMSETGDRKQQRKQSIGIAAVAAVTCGLLGTVTFTDTLHAAAPPAAKKSKTGAQAKKTPPSRGVKQAAPKPVGQTNFVDNTPLTEEQKIVHALNRLGFGPRPGDVERVKQMGLNRYIALQLQPEKIEDTAVEVKIAPFDALQASAGDLGRQYFEDIRAAQQFRKLQAQAMEKMKADGGEDADAAMKMESGQPPRPGQLLQAMTPEQRAEARRIIERRNQSRKDSQAGPAQLVVAKVIRAVESERQLNEVMVDFWTNHFNIDIRKNVCRVYKIADDRDVIRKHALGKFRDLLGASAKSPAMLVYLDNAQSRVVTPRGRQAEQRRAQFIKRMAAQGNTDAQIAQMVQQARGRGGINENYAREIMELHTLGVDGGYTQKDVQEVARCLTGWTINRQSGEFTFNRQWHDNGEKTVLGRTIPAGGGVRDGETVLDILASHPSTAKYVSYKLCQRLVADEPPASLIEKCAATWKKTDGDLREVVRTIVTSPEFFSRAAYRQKIKSPFEYAVSAARALGATYELPRNGLAALRPGLNNGGGGRAAMTSLPGWVSTMGEPLFMYQAPTGYPEDSRKWVSSGALISRLNFSLALTGGRLLDLDLTKASMQLAPDSDDPAKRIEGLASRLLHGEISPATRATLLKQVDATPTSEEAAKTDTTRRLAALILGSPEFQRR